MRFLDFTFSFYACQTNVSAQKNEVINYKQK
jgi:hypothetical protein